MKKYYNKERYEPTTEPSFVSGPPLGRFFILAMMTSYC